jgi:uncharacterized protein YndB with AHSA1/START domain
MKKVEVNLSINTTPEKVIQAFTDPNQLNEWWGVEKSLIQKKIGGLYTLAWSITEKGMGYVSSGIIRKYDPAGVLVITDFIYLNPDRPFLGPMMLTVRAQKGNDSTDVYLCQDGYQGGAHWDWYYQAVKEAWPIVVQGLKNYLES